MIWLFFLLVLGAAAVYVGTVEAAFSALMRLSLRLMAEHEGRDDSLARYLGNPVLLFVPVRLLLGLIFSLATVFIAVLVGGTGPGAIGALLLSVAVFILILVCEHLIPMFIVRRDPEKVLELLLPSFDLAVTFLQPITVALVGLTMAGERERHEAGGGEGEPPVEPSEAAPSDREPVEEQVAIERDERRLLRSIVDFGNTLVREVMTPRPDIVAIRSDATLDELRALFIEQEYSRFPVYKDNLDNILGFVFVKDLVQLVEVAGSERGIPRLLRQAYVVPETKRVAGLLKEFQQHQLQIAIVVDEYGGTAGLVTIEDLLEEIVGEIRDEYDVESEPIVDEGSGSFVVSGKVDIDKLAERLDVEIEREGFETVGGYLLSQLGRVPAVGETLNVDGLSIEVLEAERRRVHKVRIRRREVVGTDAVHKVE